MTLRADLVIVGGGAAGLFTAAWAARQQPGWRIVILDGAKKLGAKILVAGGGRCNVTHVAVTPEDYAGGSRHSIRKVLGRFTVDDTRRYFLQHGVSLKQEDTGKLFPVSDRAQDVLDALLDDCLEQNVTIHCRHKVTAVSRAGDHFLLHGDWGQLQASRLVLATGGKALPKSGSDGSGYALAQSLGHRLTERIFPALVPLRLPAGHWLTALSGLTLPAQLTLATAGGKVLAHYRNSTLLTHFGLSGPAVLDISRYWLQRRLAQTEPPDQLLINWLPDCAPDTLEQQLQQPNQHVRALLRERLPQRLVDALLTAAGLSLDQRTDHLSKTARKQLLTHLFALPLPITGDRGFTYAEVTAGGVPLNEIDPKTMASRCCPGLYLVGEILDVDGRIGGFNFQWAWASGFIAGSAQ